MLTLKDMMLKTKALVTGASGFTGQYLVKLLTQSGADVLGVGAWHNPPADLSCCYKKMDLRDAEDITSVVNDFQPDIVFHLAAISYAAHKDSLSYYEVNTIGTERLLQSLRQMDFKGRLIIASSANVYGDPNTSDPIEESFQLAPINHYGYSKICAEYLAKSYMRDLDIIIVRPFNYTGPGQSHVFVVPKIISHFKAGNNEIQLGNMSVTRDFSDVRDVVKSYATIAEKGRSGGVYNICSGQGVRVTDVIQMVEKIAGRRIEVQTNPDLVRSTDIKSLIGSNQKLRALQSQGNRIPLSQTLEDMLLA